MIIFYFLLLALMLFKVKIKVKDFHTEHLSYENTTAIKGIFAILIFMRHAVPYVGTNSLWIDTSFAAIDKYLGQGIVCLFLFYTGYGIYESYKKKRNYFDNFLENRLLKTMFSFDIAIVLFLLVRTLILQKQVGVIELAKAFVGISSLGNSNWYMFYIFIAYVIAFLSFKLCKSSDIMAICTVTILTIGYCVYGMFGGLDLWWYDTALCVPLGMLYSYFKNRIDGLLQKNNIAYYFTFALCVIVCIFATNFHFETKNVPLIIISRIFFTLAVVLFTMKVSMKNNVLIWLGKYSFGIYIMQRIPMIIISHYMPSINSYLFVAINIALTIGLAFGFTKLSNMLTKVVFAKSEQVKK